MHRFTTNTVHLFVITTNREKKRRWHGCVEFWNGSMTWMIIRNF